MKKIGAVAGSAANVSDEWTEGDPAGGIPATILKAAWLNTLQRELVNLVTHLGTALDSGNDGQLLTIIRKLTAPAGMYSMGSQISKGVGQTLNLPAGLIDIGSDNLGYLLEAQSNWDPATAGNRDSSFTALTLGDDIYIYAVTQPTGIAKWVASKNTTVPTGYLSTTSRKIGGFHYGRVRPTANRYDTAYAPTTEIVPNSCWDLNHRPKCEPTGMVEVIPGKLWVDIYLNSAGAGSWPVTVPVSAYGATAIKNSTYSLIDFVLLARNAGKRLPRLHECFVYADGALQGENASNDRAWSATANVAPTTTGAVAKAISMFNVVDPVGNLYEMCDDFYESGDYGGDADAPAFTATIAAAGQDSAQSRGQMYQDHIATPVFGGAFAMGVQAGSRCVDSITGGFSDTSGTTGIRCVCEAK